MFANCDHKLSLSIFGENKKERRTLKYSQIGLDLCKNCIGMSKLCGLHIHYDSFARFFFYVYGCFDKLLPKSSTKRTKQPKPKKNWTKIICMAHQLIAQNNHVPIETKNKITPAIITIINRFQMSASSNYRLRWWLALQDYLARLFIRKNNAWVKALNWNHHKQMNWYFCLLQSQW